MHDKKNYPCLQEEYFVDNIDYNVPMNLFQAVKASLKLLYSFEAKNKFERLIITERPDVIHLNIFQSQLTASIVDVAKKYNIPIIYTAHDLKAICPTYLMMNHGKICDACINGNYWKCISTSCMKNSKAKGVLAAMEAEVYKLDKTYEKIDLIICPSKHHQKRLIQGKIPCEKTVYLPNFLPKETEFSVGGNKANYFLFFGRLSVKKGIITLIKAFENNNIKRPLYLVGTGPQEDEIKNYISQKHLEERVYLKGFKSGAELKHLVENAFCICLPSECCENAPYSVMEAQAYGRPVIVSNNGGLPEMVMDERLGYVFKAGNVNDLENKLLLAEQTVFDYAYIYKHARKKYSYKIYLDQILHIYNDLISRNYQC